MIAILLPGIAFFTSLMSGIFGMAGGLVLMGALAFLMPVEQAFVTHGLIQIVANGWRAVLNRGDIAWRIVGNYAAAALVAGVLFSFVAWVPPRPWLFVALGLVGQTVWVPARRLALDARRPAHAFASGLLVTGTNLLAGVAGPLLDIFFVRTTLTRHQIVATKAVTQVFSHLAKVLVYGVALAGLAGESAPPWLALALALPMTIVGTRVGKRVLDRMSDAGFIGWTRIIVSAIGAVYLVRGIMAFAGA